MFEGGFYGTAGGCFESMGACARGIGGVGRDTMARPALLRQLFEPWSMTEHLGDVFGLFVIKKVLEG